MKLGSWTKKTQAKIKADLKKHGAARVLCEGLDLAPFILSVLKNKTIFFMLDRWQLEEIRGAVDIQKTSVGFFPQKPKNRKTGSFVDYDAQTYRVNINKAASSAEKISLFLIDKKTYNRPVLPLKKSEKKTYKAREKTSREAFLETLVAFGYEKKEEANEIGSFVIKGGAVDVVPFSLDKTIRFSFLGDSGLEMFFVEEHTLRALLPGEKVVVSRETKEKTISLNSLKKKNDVFCCYDKNELNLFYEKKTKTPLINSYINTFNSLFYKKNPSVVFFHSSKLLQKGVVLEKNLLVAPFWFKKANPVSKKNLFVHEMNVGDFFIHDFFGFCRFVGVDNSVEKAEKICLKFADGLIKIQVSQISDLSFFGDSSKDKPLSFLSKRGAWQRIKRRHSEAASDIALSLFSSHEERKKISKLPLKKDLELDALFSSSFKHKETKDQTKAIKEVLEDLEKKHPTTRLLCGDVGFGKTEVALRAVFMCCYNNKKSIIVAPTKILAKQLFDEFYKRLGLFGFSVSSSLSVFLNEKKDVLVSTHKALNNLKALSSCSLLIVDEEHRFGVKQKENIVSINPFSDIIYMSATPLPRSLQLAISKQRNISQINTPTLSKKQILTRLYYSNNNLIKEAILNETKRKGQVFFVDKSVYNVKKMHSFISLSFPSLRVSFLHSKLGDDKIIETMSLFRSKKIDVLVSTTIIESGIDVGSANTIIINNADFFGLSQLYQLRGRVGRGSVQAHAFLLVSKNNPSSALPRLSSLMKNQSLGSGYSVAVDDLNIRGAGSVFGFKQSGVSVVGFEYYSKLVALAIKSFSGKKEETTKISLVSGSIPLSIAPSSAERLSIYSFVSSCSSVDLLDDYYKNFNSLVSFFPLSFKALFYNKQLELLTNNTCLSELSFEKNTLSVLINKDSLYFSSVFLKKIHSYLKTNSVFYIFSDNNKIFKFQFKISIEDCYILLLKFLKESRV